MRRCSSSADLPKGVQRGNPRQQQNDRASWPHEILHGIQQSQHASTHDGSDVVKGTVPPEPVANLTTRQTMSDTVIWAFHMVSLA